MLRLGPCPVSTIDDTRPALLTWLILIGSVVATASFASGHIFSYVGWVALGFGTAALVLAVAGITVIRTRGETAVAVLSLVLVLSLTSFASPFFLYGSLHAFG